MSSGHSTIDIRTWYVRSSIFTPKSCTNSANMWQRLPWIMISTISFYVHVCVCRNTFPLPLNRVRLWSYYSNWLNSPQMLDCQTWISQRPLGSKKKTDENYFQVANKHPWRAYCGMDNFVHPLFDVEFNRRIRAWLSKYITLLRHTFASM